GAATAAAGEGQCPHGSVSRAGRGREEGPHGEGQGSARHEAEEHPPQSLVAPLRQSRVSGRGPARLTSGLVENAPDQLEYDFASFPDEVRPMQAASAEAPFSSPEYIFEVKWDGLRCLLFRDPQKHVHLHDRGFNDLTDLV